MVKYLDLNTSFKLTNAESQAVIEDMKAICQDLARLFNTPKGSVPFNREYGTTLRSLLFENNVTPTDVAVFLYQDITDFEPRIELNPSDINIVQTDRNTYTVTCNFTVPSLNNKVGGVVVDVSGLNRETKDDNFLAIDNSATYQNIYGKDYKNSYEFNKVYG